MEYTDVAERGFQQRMGDYPERMERCGKKGSHLPGYRYGGVDFLFGYTQSVLILLVFYESCTELKIFAICRNRLMSAAGIEAKRKSLTSIGSFNRSNGIRFIYVNLPSEQRFR